MIFEALKSRNFFDISVTHSCTWTCWKAISHRASSVAVFPLNREQRRSVSVMEIRSVISQATLPLELITYYIIATASVASVFLLEEEPWHIYVWRKHSFCF